MVKDEMPGQAVNDGKLMEMPGIGWNGCKWLHIAVNDCKWTKKCL